MSPIGQWRRRPNFVRCVPRILRHCSFAFVSTRKRGKELGVGNRTDHEKLLEAESSIDPLFES